MSALLLPGEPGFNAILATPPPDPYREFDYIVKPGSGGVAQCATPDELTEYLNDGEYGERLAEIDEQNSRVVPTKQGIRSSILFLPCSVSVGNALEPR